MTTGNKFFGDEVINTFYVESRENLLEMESVLLEIEKGETETTKEQLNSIFRAIHTIKGSSGMFGFEAVEHFAHIVENLLDDVRNGKMKIDPDMISILLDCKDHFNVMFDALENNREDMFEGEIADKNRELLARLNKYFKIEDKAEKDNSPKGGKGPEKKNEQLNANEVANECWHISMRPGENFLRYGFDPCSFIGYLNKIGKIRKIVTITERLPSIEEADPERCYLGYEIDLMSDISKEDLEGIFEFVMEDALIKILPPKSSIVEYIRLIDELPEKNILIGEILKEIGTLTESELNEALSIQQELKKDILTDQVKPIGEIVVDEKMVHKTVLDAAIEKQDTIRKKHSSMRIDSEKLDSLINLVGELVITGANIKQLSDNDIVDKSFLTQAVAVMSRLIEDIRDSTMSMRMVQIGETFKRFDRIVRDLSRERNKDIELIISGGDTELDKTLIEKITDPLMHIVRNSVDHGIDSPDDRVRAGKPRKGTIHLNSYHETGNIVIEVTDDGNGLNRDRIYAKAIEQGLIEKGAIISDEDLFQFIFNAGFSTAKEVTNISGRGVGMDVVRKNIESMRGTVIIDSENGKGTSIKIHLPLTLSIIDGFMFMVGDYNYVVPLDIVIECTEASAKELKSKDGGNYINLRGEVLPFMRLRDFFKVEGEEPQQANIIVVRHKGAKAGLVVDKLVGELQTVIKPLGDIFNKVKWISGSTILGSGEVAIILDSQYLIEGIKSIEKKEGKAHEDIAGVVCKA